MNEPKHMIEGKILALDIGDAWTGTAISDNTKTLARPLKTIPSKELITFLKQIFSESQIASVIVGYPKTMGGKTSQQTQKIIDMHKQLTNQFPTIPFILWDERLSSKFAQTARPSKTKEEKMHSHSIAAAFILDTYLRFLEFQTPSSTT